MASIAILKNQRVIAPISTTWLVVEIGVPPVIIHLLMGFSIINQPFGKHPVQGVTEQLRYGGVLQVVQVSLDLGTENPLVVAGLPSWRFEHHRKMANLTNKHGDGIYS